jgi:dTDP-4-amino-4,6-dideoxygalactose transaminase
VATNWHLFVAHHARFRPAVHEERNKLMLSLENQGISTLQGTHAPIAVRYYREEYGISPEHFPNASATDRLSLALPLYPQMTHEEQGFIISSLVHAAPHCACSNRD